MSKYQEFDFNGLKKYRVEERKSKFAIDSMVKRKDCLMSNFIDSLPNINKSKDFKEFIELTFLAYRKKKPILIGMGGHVIKTGMSPLIIDMMNLGLIQGICCNGSVVIHDFEISCFGSTSEDVALALEEGSFGMASDTCDAINQIILQASNEKLGYGEAIGKYLAETSIPYPEYSILRNAYELNIPITVHIALGTDIAHQHETAEGKAIGDCSLRDFRIFTNLVSQLGDGGVFINFGSAVIIPEVFLKALTVCRNKANNNLKKNQRTEDSFQESNYVFNSSTTELTDFVYNKINTRIEHFTTAVFDMQYHYRPLENIVNRPVQKNGQGFYFIGHHEIMIPLFFHCLREKCRDYK